MLEKTLDLCDEATVRLSRDLMTRLTDLVPEVELTGADQIRQDLIDFERNRHQGTTEKIARQTDTKRQ